MYWAKVSLVPYGKRIPTDCICSLAWAEMYLALAAVFHRFDMELHDTDRTHVDPVIDRFVPEAENEDGVRVLIK